MKTNKYYEMKSGRQNVPSYLELHSSVFVSLSFSFFISLSLAELFLHQENSLRTFHESEFETPALLKFETH